MIGRVADVVAVKFSERDIDTMLANLTDVMEHGMARIAVSARH